MERDIVRDVRTHPLLRCVYTVHFVLAAVVGALAFVSISGVGLLFVFLCRGRGQPAMLLARSLSVVVRLITGWRIRVEGREILASNVPAVLMVRHQSNLDIVTTGAIYPRDTVVIGKKQITKIPVFGWFFRATGNVLLDRGDLARAIASIRAAAQRVRSERISIWVFPEGHRNLRPTLLPFKKGAFHLAVEAQVPIVPIVSEPIDTILDGHCWAVRPGTYRIRVLPPVPTEGLSAEDVDGLIETVRARMQEAQDALAATARPSILGSRVSTFTP